MPRISEWPGELRERTDFTVRALHDAVRDKVIPAFANIRQETKAVYRAQLEELRRLEADGRLGDLTAEGEASLEAQCYEVGMETARQTVLNGFVVVLWHIVHQQLLAFGQRLDVSRTERIEVLDREISRRYGIRLRSLKSWALLRELWCTANAIKHGDGPSCRALRRRRPDLFDRARVRNKKRALLLESIGLSSMALELSRMPTRAWPVVAPLSRHEIEIQPADLDKYFKAVALFWHELSDQVETLEREH